MCRILLAVLFAFALQRAAIAEDAATPEENDQLARQLSRLVQRLDDDRAADRDAAEAKLLELAGSTTAEADRFLDSLPGDNRQMPPAVRERLASIRSRVETRTAEAAVEGSTVTLSAERMPVDEVFAAIEKQTGNRFIQPKAGVDGDQSRITIDVKGEPFWPVVDRILDQARLGVYAYGGENALSIVSRSPEAADRFGRASYRGPLRVELLRIQAQRDMRQPDGDSLKLEIEIAWEPRLRPIVLSQPLANLFAVTEGGTPLAVKQTRSVLDIEVPDGTQAAEIVLPFELPPRDAKRIAVLRGTLRALVPGRRIEFRFGDLATASGETQRRGGVEVTLDAVRKNNEIWEVHMRFALDEAGEALESHRGWVFQNLSYLEDKSGEPIDNVGLETKRQTPQEVGAVYLFDVPDGIEGLTWVYETPAAIVELPVEYELKEIGLP